MEKTTEEVISRLWPVSRPASVVFSGPSWHRKTVWPYLGWEVFQRVRHEKKKKKSGYLLPLHILSRDFFTSHFKHLRWQYFHHFHCKTNPEVSYLRNKHAAPILYLCFFIAHIAMDSFCSQYLYFSVLTLLSDFLHYSCWSGCSSIFYFSSIVPKHVCRGFCK